MSNRQQMAVMTVLLTVVLLLELYLLHFQTNVSFDGYSYIAYYPGSTFPPGYPLFIWLMRLLVSDGELAARLVSMLFHCGAVIVLYYIARQYASQWWALIAAALYAFNPLALRLGLDTLSESQYIFFILLGFLFLQRGRYLPTGLAIGAAYITRPEAAVVFAGIFIFMIVIKKKE